MAVNAIVNFFFGFEDSGWSEVFWRFADADLKQTLTFAETLAPLRTKLLAQNVRLLEVRVSDVDELRDSFISDKQFFAPKVANPLAANMPFTSMLLRCESGSLYRRSLYLRGFPAEVTYPYPEGDEVVNQWIKDFDKWKAKLLNTGDNWQFKALSKDPAMGPHKISVVIPSVPNPLYTLVQVPGQVFTTLESLRIAKLKDVEFAGNAPNGVWSAFNPIANSFEIATGFPDGGQYKGGGVVYRRVSTFVPITKVVPLRMTRRKVGRPIGSPKGRRKD